MNAHPTSATLENFLGSRLSREDMTAVIVHLLRGCDQCRAALEPMATAIFRSRWPEREPSPEEEAAYDTAISEACRRVLETIRRNKRAVGKQIFENLARRGRESSLAVSRA